MFVFGFPSDILISGILLFLYTAGQITSFKEDSPDGHTIGFNCRIHKDCKVLRIYKKIPDSFQAS